MSRPSPEFLASLIQGQTVRVDQGKNGIHTGRVSKVTKGQIWVRMGKELRKFSTEDGGTFQAPSQSKSWLMPSEAVGS